LAGKRWEKGRHELVDVLASKQARSDSENEKLYASIE
jgi:hypothetical protein